MCGIAGVVGSNISSNIVAKMVDSIKHRGPDGDGHFADENVLLLHTRLSILDVSNNGSQPMYSADGRYVIIFNGEVYNHIELRSKYLKGERFNSESDTETILKLYIKLGEKFVSLLRGMFAFSIYDKKEKVLFGARDRMGIKPLYYSVLNQTLVFASEISAIRESGVIPNTIEKKAVRQLFMYGSIQFPYSIVKNVFSLAPAHSFRFCNGELTTKPYWAFPEKIDTTISFDSAKDMFREKYEDAVSARLLSDRKVGVFLSAGLDSVSILAALSNLNKKEVDTFTIGFTDSHKKFTSEIDGARSLASHFGFNNISKSINSYDIGEDVRYFMSLIDQPSIDGFNTYLVSKESKSILTVALSGLGGDELMFGYPRNVNLYNKLRTNFKLPSSVSDKLLIDQLYGSKKNLTRDRLLKYWGNPKNLKLNYWASRLINSPYKINNELFEQESSTTVESDLEDFYKFDTQNYKGDTFNTISYYEMRSFMLSQLLRDMDVASMIHGIETRFPLIDHNLVEFLFSLPAHYKFRPTNKNKDNKTGSMSYNESGVKYLLSQSYSDVLPDGFLNNTKQGFQLPIHKWFQNSIGEKLADDLSSDKLKDLEFNPKKIKELQQTLVDGNFTPNHFLMNILIATI